jgi:hypothetical protein
MSCPAASSNLLYASSLPFAAYSNNSKLSIFVTNPSDKESELKSNKSS